MMTAIGVLASATAPAVPVPPAVTAESMTFPIVEASCRVSNSSGRQFDLSLRQEGGRGYLKKQNDGSTLRNRTDVTFAVLKDSGHILDRVEFPRHPLSTWPGIVHGWQGRMQSFQMQTVETESPDKFAVLVQMQWPSAAVRYLGFCDVKKVPQAPLSAVEIEQVLKQ